MAEQYRRFPDPPPDVPLHVERLSDRSVVTIKPGPVVAGVILSHRTPPMPPGFRWISRFILIGGFASFLLFILMLILMGAYVRETRLKLFAFGFAAYSSGIAALSLRVMRRGSFAPLVFHSGTFPWRLELSQRGWKTVYRNPRSASTATWSIPRR
jgi:hypothetical protein